MQILVSRFDLAEIPSRKFCKLTLFFYVAAIFEHPIFKCRFIVSYFSTQFVHCAVNNFCSLYVVGKMEVYGTCICSFVNLKQFPMKKVLVFLLISIFNLGIDLILVNH